MKKFISSFLAFSLFLCCFSAGFNVISAKNQENSISVFSSSVNELIKNYDNDEEYVNNKESAQKLIKDRLIVSSDKSFDNYGAVDKVVGLGYTVLQYDSIESAESAKEKLNSNAFNAEYDCVLSCADANSTQSTSKTWGNDRIESQETLNAIKASGKELSEVTVGIIDTGVDYTHPDLKDRIVDTKLNFSSSGKTDDSMDDQGHGTMVAGIVMQNTTENVKIKPYKVLNKDGKCATSQIISVVNHILTEKDVPSVINLSLGGEYDKLDPFEKTLRSLIESLVGKGCTVVVAAGNESSDASNFSPSNINSVITVSASTSKNEKSYYSNFGAVVDIAAPGDNIYTTNLGGGYTSSHSGTSFAAPFVTAAAATVLMLDNTLTSKEVENKIKDAAFPIVNNTGTEWCGAGILNYSALYNDMLAPVPTFCQESGAYNDIINLTANAENGYTIKYTTDNTIPTLTNGETFDDIMTIEENMSFVAVAINENGKSRYIPLNYSVIYLADESDFTITDAGAISGYTGDKTSIIVPDTINGITPVSIANSAFANSGIKVIELPETVKTIGNSSFNRCTKLTSIIAKGVTKIGIFCFYYDTALTDVDMPNVLFVNKSGFEGCSKLEKVNFNKTVEELYDSVFKGTAFKYAYFPKVYNFQNTFADTPLISADLPLLYWASGAFKNCYSLEHLYAPELEELGGGTFANCVKLTDFVKEGEYDLTKIKVLEADAFADSYFKEIELYVDAFDAGGSGVFQRCHAEYISIPNVKKLLPYTFSECKELKHINMPNFVDTTRTPYENIFTDCFSLEELYIPNAIYLPDVFTSQQEDSSKLSLKYIYAPKAVYTLYQYDNGLGFCHNLEWVYLPNIKYIGDLSQESSTVFYLSDKTEYLHILRKNPNITIVAPSNSYAYNWANNNSCTFIPSEKCIFDSFDNGSCLYNCTENNQKISLPIDIVSDMWETDFINKSTKDETYAFLIDFNNDGYINAKDYAVINKM
ncbi:MAG: S8 family serine peptidase [Eubacterium sp.]